MAERTVVMQITVLGAGGTVGRRIGGVLDADRVPWRPLDAAIGGVGPEVGQVLIGAAGGDLEGTRRVTAAALRAGIDVVDVDREAGHLRWLHALAADVGPSSGARLVGGAGLRWAVGDLLTAVAAEQVPEPATVHVAYTAGGGRRHLTPGERRAELSALGQEGVALEDGRPVPEPAGGRRRLAWFPRPVGPSHAAAVPGGEAVTVPRHLPTVRTVHSYEAMVGWRAELLQARANLARTARGRRWMERRLATDRREPRRAELAEERWGCVAEVVGGRTLGRAWAYGHDPVEVTARLAVAFGLRLAAGRTTRGEGGPLAPSELDPPGLLLDELADAGTLRWSRSHTILEDR
ncbi:MAG: hypothetical protein EA387_01945 [Nitriliruptor sp.]|nr:MAG: hypothetical protein EA387_01945 [Nitriliruptor sp.]